MRKVSHSQNVLKNKELILNILDKEEVQINQGDTVVDIGAGTGQISQCLHSKVGNSGRLVLVEIDKDLVKQLQKRFGKYSNIEIIRKNILDYSFPKTPFKIFSNIPFNYTSDILNKILDPKNSLISAYLIMQREALEMFGGERLNSRSKETLKSLINYPFFNFNKIYNFNKADFSPEPKVEIVLAGLSKRDKSFVKKENYDLYRNYVVSVSKDRVGQGVWKKVFTTDQIRWLGQNTGLIFNKGISFQSADEILKSFRYFTKKSDTESRNLIKNNAEKHQRNVRKTEKIHRTR